MTNSSANAPGILVSSATAPVVPQPNSPSRRLLSEILDGNVGAVWGAQTEGAQSLKLLSLVFRSPPEVWAVPRNLLLTRDASSVFPLVEFLDKLCFSQDVPLIFKASTHAEFVVWNKRDLLALFPWMEIVTYPPTTESLARAIKEISPNHWQFTFLNPPHLKNPQILCNDDEEALGVVAADPKSKAPKIAEMIEVARADPLLCALAVRRWRKYAAKNHALPPPEPTDPLAGLPTDKVALANAILKMSPHDRTLLLSQWNSEEWNTLIQRTINHRRTGKWALAPVGSLWATSHHDYPLLLNTAATETSSMILPRWDGNTFEVHFSQAKLASPAEAFAFFVRTLVGRFQQD